MGDVATAIVALLRANGTVNGIVGGRIDAVGLPDRMARPNIVYQVIDAARMYSNDGSTHLVRSTVQVSCYADTYPVAKTLAAAVAALFDGYRGTSDGVVIQSVFIDDERDAPAPPPQGQTRGIAGVVLVLIIAHSG